VPREHAATGPLARSRVVHFSNRKLRRNCTMDQSPPRLPITCEIDGKVYRGTYWVAGKILTVSTALGGKSKQVGSTAAKTLAEQLLRQLAQEGKALARR